MTTESVRANPGPLGALRTIPYMGVIYVVHEAMKLGFRNGDPDWCNLGQGQPEVGAIAGAPARISSVAFAPGDHAYGPINGTPELRGAIAAHYNRLYRRGRSSQYTADNVSVACGGRLMLSRIFAALGPVRLGYQTPDYTAYEDMIGYHQHRVTPVLLEAKPEDGFLITPERLEHAVRSDGLDAFLVSNPCNPTGRVIAGDDLGAYVRLAREEGCTLLMDEFYSHFHFDGERPAAGPVSSAAHIEDVEEEPVLIVDGLTKSYRYPGWRLGWTLGPAAMIEALGCAASAIDGGPSMPVQRAALAALEPRQADQETEALRAAFSRKRNLMVERLRALGLEVPYPPEGTFYVWASIAKLPAPFDDAEEFFRRALARKVMTVPGRFFDVNPGGLRSGPSPLRQWMRFSFGPPEDNVRLGLDRLADLLGIAG